MIYAITYDLNKPGQDYPGLYVEIKKLGSWWHDLDSFWLVDTALDVEAIAQAIRAKIDQSDSLLVIGVTDQRQGQLNDEAWKWIRSHL